MPITITSADYVGTPPATGIQCPVDDEKVKASDLQVIAAAVLANDDYLNRRTRVYHHPAPATSNAPTYTETTTLFTLIDGVTFDDPPAEEAALGEVIDMTFTCTVTNTVADAYVALFKQEPSDANPVEIAGARVLVNSTGNAIPVSLAATYVVAEAGVVTVMAQGAKAAVGGTLSVVEAYRFDARKYGV